MARPQYLAQARDLSCRWRERVNKSERIPLAPEALASVFAVDDWHRVVEGGGGTPGQGNDDLQSVSRVGPVVQATERFRQDLHI